MRRSLESSSRSHNLDMSKDPEGINGYADQPKPFENHITDAKKLKELIDSLPTDVEVEQAAEKVKREQAIAAARDAVISSLRQSRQEMPQSRPLDMIKDLEGTSTKRLFKSKSSTSEESTPEQKSKPVIPRDLFDSIWSTPTPSPEQPQFEPISSEPEPEVPDFFITSSEPEPEVPDFFITSSEPVPDFEPLTPEDLPGSIPSDEPTPEPVPEPASEPTPEQPKFESESDEVIKFEGRKALDTLKQIHTKLASATPDQVQRFNTLYQELSDIAKITPTDLESERQKLTNLFDVRDKINQLQSEL